MSVKVHGLRELQRDLGKYAKDVKRDLRKELQQIAEPIRSKAEGLASANISHIGPTWERMRIGVLSSGVYLAPKSRRKSGSPRPNMAALLMNESMLPATEGAGPEIEKALEAMLDRISIEDGF